MKLDKLSDGIIDLTDSPSISIIKSLEEGTVIVYEGEEYTIESKPKKIHKGAWLLTVYNELGLRVIRLVENLDGKMSKHEKKQMINNIKKNVEQLPPERIVEIIPSYLHNLKEINKYCEEDIRECMSYFPAELLKKAGVVL